MSLPTTETLLRKWWERKYRKPVTCVEFVTSYPEDLFVMFLEDMLIENEEYAAELRLKHLGVDAPLTGDPLVDLWNRQLARGERPDLDLADPENSATRDAAIRKKATEHYEATGERIYQPPLQDPFTYESRAKVESEAADLGVFDQGATGEQGAQGSPHDVSVYETRLEKESAIERQRSRRERVYGLEKQDFSSEPQGFSVHSQEHANLSLKDESEASEAFHQFVAMARKLQNQK